MPPQEIDIRTTIEALPEQIYRLLDDSSSWPTWTPIDSFELIEPAHGDGLGEVRLFHTGRITVRERIVERIPNQRLSYVLLGGLAVTQYRADIDLESCDAGTSVRWHTTFRPKVPGMGGVYRRALLTATHRFVAGLREATATRPPRTGEPGNAPAPQEAEHGRGRLRRWARGSSRR